MKTARTDIFTIQDSQLFRTQSYYKLQILNIGTNSCNITINGKELEPISTDDYLLLEIDYRLTFNDNINISFSGAGTSKAQIIAIRVEDN